MGEGRGERGERESGLPKGTDFASCGPPSACFGVPCGDDVLLIDCTMHVGQIECFLRGEKRDETKRTKRENKK